MVNTVRLAARVFSASAQRGFYSTVAYFAQMILVAGAQMNLKHVSAKLKHALLKLRRADGGNVVITFSLALLPIVGLVGAAVDYSRANSDKAAMQAAVDATALMLSKTVANMTTTQMNQSATSYFKSLFTRTDVNNIVITPTYTTSGGSQLTVTGMGNVPTRFLQVMKFASLTINVSSTVKWGNTRLRVALVLDNTGSMGQSNKITALKTATNNLLTQLKDAVTTNGDVYVSIIPFVKDVNVDPVNYNANWIDWSDWNAGNGSCSRHKYTDKNSCVSNGKTWTPNNHNTWNGCVVDRGASNVPSILNTDTNVTAPIPGVTDTMFSAEQYDPCPQALMPLSYNWTGMTNLVNNMSPGGNTNQAIGLALGWMSLVGGGPFPAPPAMDPNYKYQQVIILLTDGLNTQDRWYTDQASIDAREKMTCNNVNAAGITLYTIQVNTGGDPTSTLLQNCAGSPGKYPDSSKFFLLTSSSEIVTTFNQIGTSLSSLRVAK
jgi:Flp pilus assembly protein TadG